MPSNNSKIPGPSHSNPRPTQAKVKLSVRLKSLDIKERLALAVFSISDGRGTSEPMMLHLGLKVENFSIVTFQQSSAVIRDLELIVRHWLSELLPMGVFRVQVTSDGKKYKGEFRALTPVGNGYRGDPPPGSAVAHVEINTPQESSGLILPNSVKQSPKKQDYDITVKVPAQNEIYPLTSETSPKGQTFDPASRAFKPTEPDVMDSNTSMIPPQSSPPSQTGPEPSKSLDESTDKGNDQNE